MQVLARSCVVSSTFEIPKSPSRTLSPYFKNRFCVFKSLCKIF